MTNQLYYPVFLTFFAFFGCPSVQIGPSTPSTSEFQPLIDSIRHIYAPDKRVVLFSPELVLSPSTDCYNLRGRTNHPTAATALRTALTSTGICWQDSLTTLPHTQLGADTLGIINVSVANLRSAPKHSAELATQALLGMPIRVFDQQGDWYLIQTPDKYLAWLEAGAFKRMNQSDFTAYYQEDLAFVNKHYTRLSDNHTASGPIRNLTLGNLVQVGAATRNGRLIRFPDGATGYLPDQDLTLLSDWLSTTKTLRLPELARSFYGAPYLWGGTSARGMDCSGFTKMVYWLNGYVIPRDASQQVHAGQEVPIDDQFSVATAGDLLFFGNLREDGSQRITHVGIYLGDGRFVHSGADNGYIQEQSLLPDQPDYAAHRRESLLRIKRLAVGTSGVQPIPSILPVP